MQVIEKMRTITLPVFGLGLSLLVLPSLAQLKWPGCADPVASDFRKVSLVDRGANDIREPVQLAVANDGKVYWVELRGNVKVWKPDSKAVVTLGKLNPADVGDGSEFGLSGLALDPKFDQNGWIYLYYASKATDGKGTFRISRFKIAGDKLDLATEKILLVIPNRRTQCCHTAGSMNFGPDGNLYIGVGDNNWSSGADKAPAINPSQTNDGDYIKDARRTAANTNELLGKILRIKPAALPDDGAAPDPGPDKTYSIPAGNLKDYIASTMPGADLTKVRAEVYTMGNRNPYTVSIDPATGWLVWGEVGPDNDDDLPGRAPSGRDEFNLTKSAGNFGWPLFIGENLPVNEWDFVNGKTGPKFDLNNPVNNSKFNTGLVQLPKPIAAILPYSRDKKVPVQWPGMGGGGQAAVTGPIYRYNPQSNSKIKFPPHFHGKWMLGEFSHNWLKVATLNPEASQVVDVAPFPLPIGFRNVLDMEFGPDGALYTVEYAGWFSYSGDTKISRIEYTGNCAPTDPVSLKPGTHSFHLLALERHLMPGETHVTLPAGYTSAQVFDLKGEKVFSVTRNQKEGDELFTLPHAQSGVLRVVLE